MTYTNSIILIVPAASIASANALAATLRPNPADAATFRANCSATGAPGSADHAISGPTPILASKAALVMGGMVPNVPGAIAYVIDAASGNLLQTNSTTAQIGQPWGAEQALADQGLVMIQATM